MGLTGKVLRLYEESTPDIQMEFMRLQTNREKARELADMVGSVAVDEELSLEVLELVAVCLIEDCKQIRQAAEDMKEEQQAIRRIEANGGKEGERGRRDRKIHDSIPEC